MKKLLIISALVVAPMACSSASEKQEVSSSKSEQKAVQLSVLCHVVPLFAGVAAFSGGANQESGNEALKAAGLVAIATGVIIGPGVGHLYAENHRRFRTGVAIRTGLFVVAGVAIADIGEDGGGLETGLAIAGVIAGTMVLVEVSSILDMTSADNSARSYNEKLKAKQISLTPRFDFSNRTPGFVLTLSF